ncbi:ADP-ribosylglycohydrolase [Opitutaceae bacterium TAV4]|nr:ADP-ribosylglycohydrolase [Opitutaceae bacterium TAV4]RRJ99167.1 ADP-ribosylglycohydrolase [Opitutaceae bacterium TAV3]
MTSPDIQSRILGCWLGKSVGGTLGLPAEGRMDRLSFTFYDPVPTIAPPNDDLELQLVWLDLVGKLKGSSNVALTLSDFARAWLENLHYMWDEYGRCRWNLRRGVPVNEVGVFENHFVSGMGSPIRSEIWACLFPGDAASAAYYASLDAALDHGVEGIAGEVLFAAMQAHVAGGKSVAESIALARPLIPADCETTRAVALVIDDHAAGAEAWASREKLLAAHGNDNFTHAPLNVALTIWALLHGGGDFEKSILLAVNGGYDTDCTAATVGATIGLALGDKAIPARWVAPIGDGVFIGPGIQGINAPTTLGELTRRTAALIGKLAPHPAALDWAALTRPPATDVTRLPGTIKIRPLGAPADGSADIAWANGELPAAVKAAGGATWDWTPASGEKRLIVNLARKGARLFVDEKLVVDCPAGVPYVPAVHRPAEASRGSIVPEAGRVHRVRVELLSRDPKQDASVILAYPNRHIAPWTTAEIPHLARLLT